MTPTNKLRFVESTSTRSVNDDGSVVVLITIRILQQWWAFEEDVSIGEWRDVPLEKEA